MKNKKNVILITTDYPPQKSGIASWAVEEYKKLKTRFNVIVIDKLKQEYKQKSDVLYFKNNNDLKSHLINIFKRKKIEYVIFFHWEVSRNLFLWLKFRKIPYIIVLHGWSFLRPRSKYTNVIKKLILKFSNEIWVASPYLKNKVLKYKINEKKIKMVLIPVNQKKFIKFSKEKRNKFKKKYGFVKRKIIISVARLVKRKDFFTVLSSIKTLQKKYPQILYIIVGDGEIKNEILTYIKKYNLTSNVLLAGEISEKKLIEYYNISDLFVLTPIEIKADGDIEGFGIVYHEAHACGLPVIGSDTGGVKYSLSLIDNSYIIKEKDDKQLTRLILKLILF